MESPSGTIHSWQLEVVERLLNQLTMEKIGVVHLLELQILSMESPSGTIYLWLLEVVERLLNQLTMEKIGVVQLLELQIISMESLSVIKSKNTHTFLFWISSAMCF